MTDLGITGTRNGMTKEQQASFELLVESLLKTHPTLINFHQGQCIGVDVEAANYLHTKNLTIISHSPIKVDLIGESHVDISMEPQGYFQRNRNIVDSSQIMIVVPYTNEHQSFGGTWYTHDYAVKRKKIVYVIYPEGRITCN